MGGTTLHAGIVAQWFEILLVFKISYYGRQWDLIWCNDTINGSIPTKIQTCVP